MVVLRPGSSVLKPGVRERQRELETVITKYELLLAIGRTKNADFALDLPQLVYHLAECRLCLVRLQRTTWQIDQSGYESAQTRLDSGDEASTTAEEAEAMQITLQDALEKTRRLYQLPEVAKTTLAAQGEVQVLFETGELFTYCRDHANAMAAYAEAIRLCYNIEDEATEAILLQRHADAMERVESLVVERASDGDKNPESERSKMKAAFAKLADANGFLEKAQLQSLAQELGMADALSNSEIDEIWRQVLISDKTGSKITFDVLWRWWVSDTVYGSMWNNDLL